MEELIYLGTGAAMNTDCFTTALLLRDGLKGRHFLMDTGGGNGILHRLRQADIPPEAITDVFISHHHTDHILGAPWLMRLSGHGKQRHPDWPPLHIYGSPALLDTLMAVCRPILPSSVLNMIGSHIRLVPVESGTTCPIGPWQVTFFDIGAAKVEQYGCQIRLQTGERLVYLGDEPLRAPGMPYAREADYLIHEAYIAHPGEGRFSPKSIGHSTVAEAAANARDAGARHLILFHSGLDATPTRRQDYISLARETFTGEISAPNDLDSLFFEHRPKENHQ